MYYLKDLTLKSLNAFDLEIMKGTTAMMHFHLIDWDQSTNYSKNICHILFLNFLNCLQGSAGTQLKAAVNFQLFF